AICSQLVDLMGGTIRVESEMGRGSTFCFTARFKVGKEPAQKAAPTTLAGFDDLRVLVVDDNATNRRLLDAMLTRRKMKPVLADGGRAAIAALEQAARDQARFSLVLLDYHMPEMDGFSVAAMIRGDEQLSAVPIIMLTSATQQGTEARCRELGINAHMMKPVTESLLLRAISDALGLGSRAAQDESLAAEPSSPAGVRPLRILLVDDNAINQRLGAKLLEIRGHTVVLAGDGAQAVEAYEREPFDLVLMDVQMPVMNGFEATARIREKQSTSGRRIPIVAMTARAMKGDREECLAAGMDDYVSKPFRASELEEVISGLIDYSAGHDTATRGTTAEPGAPTDRSIFDISALLDNSLGDVELAREIVGIFLDQYQALLSAIGSGISSNNSSAVNEAAHKLKGSLVGIQAPAACRAVQRLEEMGRAGNLGEAQRALRSLEQEITRLKGLLDNFLNDPQACAT